MKEVRWTLPRSASLYEQELRVLQIWENLLTDTSEEKDLMSKIMASREKEMGASPISMVIK